jgi:hypothetical protein
MATLVDTNRDKSLALCYLFKTFIKKQALVSTKNGASQAAQNIVKMITKEMVALQSIFKKESTYLTKDFMQFPITSKTNVGVLLNMEVNNPLI